jgi:hypothetical protein
VLPADGGVPEKCQLWLSGARFISGTSSSSSGNSADVKALKSALSAELAQELHVKDGRIRIGTIRHVPTAIAPLEPQLKR